MNVVRPRIDEISIMRPILVCFLLIMYHSFAPYGGNSSWKLPMIDSVPFYFWTDKFVFSFMLEALVFISGYVFSFQLYTIKKEYTIKSLLRQKTKRLIIPSLFFSFLYVLLYQNLPTTQWDCLCKLFEIINGVGHMWFCPMLFWCFILSYFVMHIKCDPNIKLAFLFFISLFSIFPLPFQLGQTSYYLFFFYLGIWVYRAKDKIITCLLKRRSIFITICLFGVSFILLTAFREQLCQWQPSEIKMRIIKLLIFRASMIVYSLLGLISLYTIILKLVTIGINVPNWLLKTNQLCMGVYIFHQFVLQTLYFRTELPEICGKYVLPWMGYFITLTISVLLSVIVRSTKLGRKLI